MNNIKCICCLLVSIFLQELRADLIDETFPESQEEILPNDEASGDDISDIAKVDEDTLLDSSNDHQNELIEIEEAVSQADDTTSIDEEEIPNSSLNDFIITQADQASEEITDKSNVNNTLEPPHSINVNSEIEKNIPNEEQAQYIEKNIVEYTLPEETNIIDGTKQLIPGELVDNAIELSEVVIQVLDKKSTKCKTEKITINKPLQIGDLTIVLRRAFMTPENTVPFYVEGYLEIYNLKNEQIFHNWLCSAFPSGITFDHPLYDIKITNEKDI